MYSMNMSNTQQNNIQHEIEQIKKEIDLLQDRLKKNEKRIQVKKGTGWIFLKPKKYKI